MRTWVVESIFSKKTEELVLTRRPSTTIAGEAFDRATVEKVWAKAKQELWFTYYKRDVCAALIRKDDYGTESLYGWEIDHIKPVSQGGTDDLSNLQPLHWENNRHKAENYPDWTAKKKS